MEVEIRPLKYDDAKTSVKWRNDPLIWEKTINSPDRLITLKEEQDWMAKVLKDSTSKRFAILADFEYVGNVQLTNIIDNESYFGIFIGETSFWGKGIASKATILIIIYAFNKLNISSIKLRVIKSNKSAFAVYKKLGFKVIQEDKNIFHMKITIKDFKWNI